MFAALKSKTHTPESSQEEMLLINERNTWRLIYCLYKCRLSPNECDSNMETDKQSYHLSEKTIIANLYKNDQTVRELQYIVDWLEKNALDQLAAEPSPENFTDKTIAWENTLHQINNKNNGIPYTSSRPIVSSLDPDAPTREGKPLHDLDREDDARLEKRMFLEVYNHVSILSQNF